MTKVFEVIWSIEARMGSFVCSTGNEQNMICIVLHYYVHIFTTIGMCRINDKVHLLNKEYTYNYISAVHASDQNGPRGEAETLILYWRQGNNLISASSV